MKISSINGFRYNQNKNVSTKNSNPQFKGSSLGGGKIVYEVVKESAKATGFSTGSPLFGALCLLGLGVTVAKHQQDKFREEFGDKALEEEVMDRIRWDCTLG